MIGGAAIVALALVIALVAGGDDDGSEESGGSRGGGETTIADEAAFQSRGGDIRCLVTFESATCSIDEVRYDAGAAPADCDLAVWGHVVTLEETAPARLVCADDTPTGGVPILPYGKNILTGPFACTSIEDGVRCTNVDNGHGFQIAPGSLARF
jgi:hypothetical protein